jgi:hypothetical protein
VQSTRLSAVVAALLCFASAGLPAVRPGPQKSTVGCATCHQSEVASQPATLMAHALQLPGANPILQANPRLTFRRGGYTYTMTTQGTQSTYSVTDGERTLSVPVQWGFGAGAQTWLFTQDGKYYESLVSYFPGINGLDITLGDDIFAPRTLLAALGRELSQQEVKDCFGCHATGAVVDDKLDLSAFKPGVTCEHCHLGAGTHMADALHSQFHSVPADLGAMSSESLSNFCGQCHRSWSTVVTHLWFGEVNVRFSPYRLANSKCFNGADSRIRCVACHNPHVNVNTSSVSYDVKCLACHSPHPVASVSTPHEQQPGKMCPVAKSNCIRCHMPKVKLANGHLAFTDHFIRIVKPGEPYPD